MGGGGGGWGGGGGGVASEPGVGWHSCNRRSRRRSRKRVNDPNNCYFCYFDPAPALLCLVPRDNPLPGGVEGVAVVEGVECMGGTKRGRGGAGAK